jgi:hypothetical protein
VGAVAQQAHTVLTKSNPCYETRFSRRVQSSALYIAFAISYNSNVAHMKRASSVQHPRNIRASSLRRFMTRLLRVCRPFMYCRCLALLARRKCAGPWVYEFPNTYYWEREGTSHESGTEDADNTLVRTKRTSSLPKTGAKIVKPNGKVFYRKIQFFYDRTRHGT